MESCLRKERKRKKENDSTDKMCSAVEQEILSTNIQQFQVFQKELDARYDKYERIVKLSRDITIRSKRVIFLLHRCTEEESREKLLAEAMEKIGEVKRIFEKIALELRNEDSFQFQKAYSPGLQEFIEAYGFWYFLKHGRVVSLEEVRYQLSFKNKYEEAGLIKLTSTNDKLTTGEQNYNSSVAEPTTKKVCSFTPPVEEDLEISSPSDKLIVVSPHDEDCINVDEGIAVIVPSTDQITVLRSPADYILGICDLTGELMRLAINSIGQGNIKSIWKICKVLRQIHDEIVKLENKLVHRGLAKKLEVLKNNMRKVENACYTLQIRGAELPVAMLIDLVTPDKELKE
ncbi:translin-associated protein X-like [Xenia sp. Carnegie-2017]|uniref:translin-associated protein X-like n=1 Tax=Xenia sp. Carnegie-2017 TaxID=2897299 RepID=UPI001F04CF3F|nr:translin-associated protein X-like [Xenia sp. Carnegie-2017]